jgi:glycerophosphoryl diester phosphodiesterase
MLAVVVGRPLVIAHRGASMDRAEHTLGAYQLAVDQGADGLECDVRLTADGHLVCVHDRRIDRTSNGWGVVSTRTLEQLSRYDFGSWVESGPGPRRRPLRERRVTRRRLEAWPGEAPVVDPQGAVLTLPILLDLVTSSPRRITLAIETKHPTRYAGLVEEQVVAQLRHFGLTHTARDVDHPVRLMSFSALAVRRFRTLAPAVPRVFLFERMPISVPQGELPFGAKIAGIDVALLRRYPEYVAKVRRAGGEVYVWTVDDPSDMRWCRRLGVEAIITNRPQEALAALAD